MPGRATVAWFESAPAAAFAPGAFPVFIAHDQETQVPFYGFPEIGGVGGERAEERGAGEWTWVARERRWWLTQTQTQTKKTKNNNKGVKLGAFKVSDDCDPDNLDRGWHASDEAPLRAFLEKFAPRAAGARLNQSSCMFAMTPDNHFIIDAHPRCPQVRLRCLSYLFWGLLVRIANQRPSKHAHTK